MFGELNSAQRLPLASAFIRVGTFWVSVNHVPSLGLRHITPVSGKMANTLPSPPVVNWVAFSAFPSGFSWVHVPALLAHCQIPCMRDVLKIAHRLPCTSACMSIGIFGV